MTISIALGVTQLSMTTALAEETCEPFLDLADKYSLGQIPIGAIAQNYLSSEDLRACLEYPYGIDEVCDYTGEDGIDYEIWYHNGKPETATIARASTSDVPPKRLLIAGPELGEPMDTVLRKLKTLPRQLPDWQLHEEGDRIWLDTGPCWRSSNGAAWKYTLIFGNTGKLGAVSADDGNYVPVT